MRNHSLPLVYTERASTVYAITVAFPVKLTRLVYKHKIAIYYSQTLELALFWRPNRFETLLQFVNFASTARGRPNRTRSQLVRRVRTSIQERPCACGTLFLRFVVDFGELTTPSDIRRQSRFAPWADKTNY